MGTMKKKRKVRQRPKQCIKSLIIWRKHNEESAKRYLRYRCDLLAKRLTEQLYPDGMAKVEYAFNPKTKGYDFIVVKNHAALEAERKASGIKPKFE